MFQGTQTIYEGLQLAAEKYLLAGFCKWLAQIPSHYEADALLKLNRDSYSQLPPQTTEHHRMC